MQQSIQKRFQKKAEHEERQDALNASNIELTQALQDLQAGVVAFKMQVVVLQGTTSGARVPDQVDPAWANLPRTVEQQPVDPRNPPKKLDTYWTHDKHKSLIVHTASSMAEFLCGIIHYNGNLQPHVFWSETSLSARSAAESELEQQRVSLSFYIFV